MAIIKGEKVKKAFSGNREYAQEKESNIVFMSSGLKLRKAAMDNMGIKAGDSVWYFIDDETGSVYLAKVDASEADSSKIGENHCFSNKGLTEKLFELADKSFEDFEKGDHLVCEIAEEPVEGEYFEITFKEYKSKDSVEAEEVQEEEEEEI